MLNFILFNNNLNFIKEIGNIIFYNFPNIHLSGIATNSLELSNLSNSNKINMIILSYSDFQDKSLFPLLNKIENKIVICDNSSNFKCSKHILYLNQNEDSEILLFKLNKFLSKINDDFIRMKVYLILERFHFDFKLVGTTYLQDAIVYAYLTKEKYLFENLEKDIYPYLSQKYNICVSNIKGAIIRSINNMKEHLTTADLKRESDILPEKLTSKFIISEIVNKI